MTNRPRDPIGKLLAKPENATCADCQQKPAKWASTTLGVFICIDCSGHHRSLGTHISFVRSCTLDAWSEDQILFMQTVGNRIANEYWEANLPRDFDRPDPTNSYQLASFIRQKYVNRTWAGNGPPPGYEATEPKVQSPQMISRPVLQSDEMNEVDFFGDKQRSARRAAVQRTAAGVTSADRKPGTKLPERLARKLKQQGSRAEPVRPIVPMKPPPRKEPASSEPSLTAIAPDSDSDDPFA
jgi:hypothetical protein